MAPKLSMSADPSKACAMLSPKPTPIPTASFLIRIPPEVRMMIYRALICPELSSFANGAAHPEWTTAAGCTKILRLNRQIYDEAFHMIDEITAHVQVNRSGMAKGSAVLAARKMCLQFDLSTAEIEAASIAHGVILFHELLKRRTKGNFEMLEVLVTGTVKAIPPNGIQIMTHYTDYAIIYRLIKTFVAGIAASCVSGRTFCRSTVKYAGAGFGDDMIRQLIHETIGRLRKIDRYENASG